MKCERATARGTTQSLLSSCQLLLSSRGFAGVWGGNKKSIMSSQIGPEFSLQNCIPMPSLSSYPFATCWAPGYYSYSFWKEKRKILLWRTTVSILSYLARERMPLLALPNRGKGLKTFSLSHLLWPQWANGSEMVTKVKMFSVASF